MGPTIFHPYPRQLESLFADVILKTALSSQLVEDPDCWSTRGLNPRPPAQQTTAALLTELPRRRYPRDKSYPGDKYQCFFQIVMTRTPSVEDGSKVDYVTVGNI